MKLEVGQKLWLVEKEFGKPALEPREVKVEKVGKKYFYLTQFKSRKFDVVSLKVVSEFSISSRCYFTLEEILAGNECRDLWSKIKEYVNRHGEYKKLSLEQLRKVEEILSVITK